MTIEIDDSALFHYSKGYDPVKAREYYLRTRQLKGRTKGSTDPPAKTPVRGGQVNLPNRTTSGGRPNRADTKSRRAELQAQKEALEKRLEKLRDVLRELVEAAKKRSGGDPNKSKDSEKDKAPETQQDKADRSKAEKKDKPETAAEKKERAKKAKEAYEKEHPTGLSEDVKVLQAQVEDIENKIRKALADAAERRKKAGSDNTKSGSINTQTSGSRGR